MTLRSLILSLERWEEIFLELLNVNCERSLGLCFIKVKYEDLLWMENFGGIYDLI